MADDINPTLRAQLVSDRDAMAPAIRGLPDIAQTSVSSSLVADFQKQLEVRVRRRDLIQAVLDEMDRTVSALQILENDGWPAPVSVFTLDAGLFAELQGEQTDLEAAVAVFRAEANINVNTAAATFTSQEPPTQPGP